MRTVTLLEYWWLSHQPLKSEGAKEQLETNSALKNYLGFFSAFFKYNFLFYNFVYRFVDKNLMLW